MSKKDIRPFVDIVVKDTIYRFSDITGISILRFCEDMCIHAFNEGISEELSPYFKRDIQIDGVKYKGNRNAMKFEYQSKNIERITLQLEEEFYDYAQDLAYAMRTSLSKVVGYTLEKMMSDYHFLNAYVNEFLIKKLNDTKRELLLRTVEKVNKENKDKEFNVTSLVLYIGDEYRRFENGYDCVLEDGISEVIWE